MVNLEGTPGGTDDANSSTTGGDGQRDDDETVPRSPRAPSEQQLRDRSPDVAGSGGGSPSVSPDAGGGAPSLADPVGPAPSNTDSSSGEAAMPALDDVDATPRQGQREFGSATNLGQEQADPGQFDTPDPTPDTTPDTTRGSTSRTDIGANETLSSPTQRVLDNDPTLDEAELDADTVGRLTGGGIFSAEQRTKLKRSSQSVQQTLDKAQEDALSPGMLAGISNPMLLPGTGGETVTPAAPQVDQDTAPDRAFESGGRTVASGADVFGSALAIDSGLSVAQNLPGAAAADPGGVVETGAVVGDAAAEAGVRAARERPAETTGAVAGIAAVGAGSGAALRGGRRGASAVSRRLRGDSDADTPSTGRGGGTDGSRALAGRTDVADERPDPFADIDPADSLRGQQRRRASGGPTAKKQLLASDRGQLQLRGPKSRGRSSSDSDTNSGATGRELTDDRVLEQSELGTPDPRSQSLGRRRVSEQRELQPDAGSLDRQADRIGTRDPTPDLDRQTTPRTTATDRSTTTTTRSAGIGTRLAQASGAGASGDGSLVSGALGRKETAEQPQLTVDDTVDATAEDLGIVTGSGEGAEGVVAGALGRREAAGEGLTDRTDDGTGLSPFQGDRSGQSPFEDIGAGPREYTDTGGDTGLDDQLLPRQDQRERAGPTPGETTTTARDTGQRPPGGRPPSGRTPGGGAGGLPGRGGATDPDPRRPPDLDLGLPDSDDRKRDEDPLLGFDERQFEVGIPGGLDFFGVDR